MIAPPMNATVAPAPAQGMPARDGSEPGFAQCLEQAVERDPAAPATKGQGTGQQKEVDAGDDSQTAEPADSSTRSATARGPRRAPGAAAQPREAEAAPTAALPTAAAESDTPAATDVVDASAEDTVKTLKKGAAPDLSSLLPGWAPPPATPAAPAVTVPAVGSTDKATAIDTAVPATAVAAQAAPHAEPHGTAATAQPHEAAAPTAFTLPPPAAAVQNVTRTDDTPAPVHAHVAAPVDSPAFAPALATQVRWLVRDGLQHAQLSLNPAEMGPVTVQIVLDGREARIDFRADLALTRNAIESSLPVLAAALDESGLRLTGGGVHDGQTSRHPQGAMAQGGTSPGASGRGTVALDDETTARTMRAPAGPPRGLVDLVA
jgi:flagellar hook-length control protein FliK